jgi:Two component regulator propeller
MNSLKKNCTFTLLILAFFTGNEGIAQLAIGQWRDQLSYKKGISVTQSAEKIYCATESGMFMLAKTDNSIERLSKISGLSDVGVNTIRYNEYDNTLLIAYSNANIDLVKGTSIYNISDIKRSIINAKKTINSIHYRNNLAYLACGFGIVVLDMDKREIKETYYIGTNGEFINVREVTSDAFYLYAATDVGVYYASLTSANLVDFKSWNKFGSLPSGIYNTIASFAGKIYTNYSAPPSQGWGNDTIFRYDGIKWSNFLPNAGLIPVRKIEASHDKLLVSHINYLDVYDSTDQRMGTLSSYNLMFEFSPYQGIVDNTYSDTYWIADNENGLTKNYQLGWGADRYTPNGPNSSEVYSMSFAGEDLWVTRGNRTETWAATYKPAESYRFNNENWSSVTKTNIPALDSLFDVVSVAIDPANKEHLFLGTAGRGLVEIDNGSLVQIWNEYNSTLQSTGWSSTFRSVQVFGLTFDADGNLWVSNSTAPDPLSVLKKDRTWQSFNFSSLITNPTASNVLVDRLNQKWMVLPRGNGIIVFNDNGTSATGDDKMKRLTSIKGNGNLPSNEIGCIAEDHDGEMWVGTDKGIAVFYCADQVLSSTGCDAQQVFIQQDGHTQILLETEVITTIAIDGANRKWIGTQNSGAYLMSADGTTQIQHFTMDNSPLLSNEITSIAINPKTGEVYFGTVQGIVSYRNDAIEGLTDYTNVYVFPNPVKPGYEGPIAITGLVENANVKITDISGNIVYQTKALGGQAIWYGRNFKNEKAHSGIYMVFCSNDDGSKTFITKILLVN